MKTRMIIALFGLLIIMIGLIPLISIVPLIQLICIISGLLCMTIGSYIIYLAFTLKS